jgi:pilus assembly protein Flp/PilA
MSTLIESFWSDESGATAIEYGLIATLIAVAIIGAVTAIGGGLSNQFNNAANGIKGAG